MDQAIATPAAASPHFSFDANSLLPETMLCALPLPLMVMLADRSITFINDAAQLLAAEGLIRVRDGRLWQLGQLEAEPLDKLLSMAACGSASRKELWFSPSLAIGWLHLAPLSAPIQHVAHWPEQSLLLAVHLDQPALTQAARIDALTRRFRLTRAERHVLLLLADGEPVEATSRHLGLSVSTVRTHVRNLLGKTQSASLMQLLRWTGSAGLTPH